MIHGAQISSTQSFLYGRFECSMKPAYGSGIVSSFFLFYDGKDFMKNWSEIDIVEVLGQYTNLIHTNVITTASDKNMRQDKHTLPKRSTDQFWKISVDWNRDRIIWFVNDKPIRTLVITIKTPMKIMLNIWKSDNANWAGPFNDGVLPQIAEYEYVKYTSLDGKTWQDDFQTLDLKRWQIADWTMEGSTQWVKENVSISGNGPNVARRDAVSNLILKLT